MKKNLKKVCNIFMVFAILLSNFMPIIKLNASNDVSSTISLQVIGSELEYNIDAGDNNKDASYIRFSINGSNNSYNLNANQVNYHYTNEEIDGYTSKEAYNYEYTKTEDTVTFNFITQWDDVIESLVINNKDYTSQVPKTKADLINAFDKDIRTVKFNITGVDYSSNYNIVINGEKQEEKIMGNFGWSYNENDSNVQEDEKIPHGKLEFIKAVYNGNTYDTIASINAAGNVYQWKDGTKKSTYEEDDDTGHGEAMFPTGTELTLKLIPDKGYQLTSLNLNGQSFEAGTEVGTYTFIITGGNFHLGAEFTLAENVVNSESDSVEEGSIDINLNQENSFENGTAKLVVSDANISANNETGFNSNLPEGYEVDNYLDISLYNSIYKGTNNSEESWDSKIDELDNDATINLKLSDDVSDKDIKVIHELHEGSTVTGYEVLDATYNEGNNTISFDTDGFSNYAIVSKYSEKQDYEVSDSKGNKIEFNRGIGHTYTFDMVSYIGITDEELEAFEMSREEYNYLFSGIKNATKKYGNILGIYEMILVDENDNDLHEGPFKIKIKMTDEMKKYNAFSIIYTDTENNFATETPINLKVEGNYLVGELEHLSVYTVVGYNITDSKNPKTNDNILSSFIFGGLSLISLTSCILYIKKKKYN